MSAELKDPQAPTGNSDINAAVGDVLDKAVVTLDSSAIAEFIQQSTPAELARFIESVPAASRAELWGLVPATMRGALLPELHQAVLRACLKAPYLNSVCHHQPRLGGRWREADHRAA